MAYGGSGEGNGAAKPADVRCFTAASPVPPPPPPPPLPPPHHQRLAMIHLLQASFQLLSLLAHRPRLRLRVRLHHRRTRTRRLALSARDRRAPCAALARQFELEGGDAVPRLWGDSNVWRFDGCGDERGRV
eukprot:1197569-Prymnesium_polylepis.2